MDWDAYQRNLLAIIDRYGVAVQGYGNPGDNPPPFQHTVGLAAHDHPEFIIFGPSMQIGQGILNDIAATVLSRSMTFAHGDIVEKLVHGYSVRLVEVVDTREHLNMSNWIYATGPHSLVSALQIVFPDERGRWPWERGSRVSAFPFLGQVPGKKDGTRKVIPR